MPTVDGMVLIGPHPGQGALLLNCIDPSVADENDALSVAPELDPLAPANGYQPGGRARYAPAFVERYREAQRQRVARLDEQARRMIAERMQARAALKEQTEPSPELRRQAAHTPVMVVWRSDADLRCLDLSLDPSDRHPGSLWGKDPMRRTTARSVSPASARRKAGCPPGPACRPTPAWRARPRASSSPR